MSKPGDKKLTIPKFSSFKPKAPAAPPPSSERARDRKGERDERPKEERARHESLRHDDFSKTDSEHRRQRRKRSRSRDHGRSRSQERALVKRVEVAQFLKEKPIDGIFFIDKKGDPLIRRYGGNDRSRVPLYRRSGRGRVLGSGGYLHIHRDGPQERFSIRQPGEGSSTLRDRALFQSKTRLAKPFRIRVRSNPASNDAHLVEEDFVPLSKSSDRRRAEEPGSSGDENTAYRSINGKAKAHEFSDSDIDFNSDAEDGELDVGSEDPLRQRSIQLSRRVKEYPGDIEAWLELINHQNVLLNAGGSLDREATKAEVHSFAEIKISMFESALSQAKKPEDEERLLLGLMLEAAHVWSPSKLESRWAELAKKHDDSFCLWKARVDYKLTNLAAFQYNDIKDLLVDRLQTVYKQAMVSMSPGPSCLASSAETQRYEQMVYVFLRATRFMYDAGFRELAVASWQALLELNLQRPAVCDTMAELQIISSFKDFWEDEAPRIGEDHALGWSHYVQMDGVVDPPEPQTDDDSVPKSRDVYKSWGATERLRAMNSRIPARATDDVLEDDPYRVVMFSDIEELLFVIPSEVMLSLWKPLVDAFLLFCGLPTAFRTSEWIEAAENDTMVVSDMRLLEKDVLQKPNEPDVLDETKRVPIFKQDASRYALSADLLFAGCGWFSPFCGWISTSKDSNGPVTLSVVSNTLGLLLKSRSRQELAEYSLAIEVVNDPSNTKKRAKAFIKQDPTNLRLYNAYALAEASNGNVGIGLQVVRSAASLITQTSNSTGGSMLWNTWAWLELHGGNNTQAIVRLCAAADQSWRNSPATTPSPSQLLQAYQSLSASLEHQISMKQLDEATTTAESLAMLAYLTAHEGSEPTSEAQGSISAAMERIWTVSSELCAQGRAKSSTHERLLQVAARLLYHHASRGPFRRAYLKDQLSQCIELFPRNTLFLSLFSWASTTFGIDDPVRDILRKVALTNVNDSISNRVFAIRYELQRGNVYSTQAAFERALDSRTCKSNPDLWRCYIKFSYARSQLRHKAKDVFFRGLRHCPWSKELALEAYTTLISVMDEFELRSVFNTMSSKGLRIHVDLDEFLATHK
ncbi:hypothetical protein CORC01_04570 [Colletotrichum orchidophilum]|uniref:NRDE-2, necessary for RNA interference n=1 Tax=Colletotrichum orchidophilum TaxID=1209926 RepID=A0A1G4BFF0_9PEZI|nr:uncharacterized protein CORC01_04570 [Colletotrichum orchidophilum]OHF00162.1 hypothetical protein CORC01_04570 [Colletotrichum orchidophilum]